MPPVPARLRPVAVGSAAGKSAILTAIVVCLGGRANAADRGNSLGDLIMHGKKCGLPRGGVPPAPPLKRARRPASLTSSVSPPSAGGCAGRSEATVTVKILNGGQDAFRPTVYGKHVVIERTLRRTGASTYRIMGSKSAQAGPGTASYLVS